MGDRTCVILKGPKHFGASLGLGWVVLRFFASSQIFCPRVKGTKRVCLVSNFCAVRTASCAYLLLSFRVVSRCSRRGRKVVIFD